MAKKKKQPPQETDQKTMENAKEAVRIGTQLIDTWDKGTRNRFNDIQEKEENYFGKVRPRTSGRSNFPVPVLARYVDEIKSRLDESPSLKFDSSVSISRELIAKKATAVIKDLKKPSKGNWNKYDRNSRQLAIFAGYNAVDFYSEDIDGNFQLNFDPIDTYEFVFELGGGNDLEKHSGVGRFPIWRTKSELKSRAKSGFYHRGQVEKILQRGAGGSDFKKHDEFFKSKFERYKSLGIDVDNFDYIGQTVYPLAQLQMTLDFGDGAERYLVTFDYNSGIWVRFVPLKTVFPSGRYSIDLWQTHEDQNTVMCKAPVDDIWPFAEGIRVKVNQLFDNHTQRIYGQRGYDPNFVPDPSALPWRQASQLTRLKSWGGKPISNGIYEFKTEDMTESTLKFVGWMDEFLTSVVGINPNDVSEEVAKVGIMFGQLQKTAARMGTANKSYREMWERLGFRALWEMKQYLTETQTIKIIGTKGAEWHEFSGEELKDPSDFDILAEGSNVELEMSEARKKRQGEVIDKIVADLDMKQAVNSKALTEYLLKSGEFSEDEVGKLMDTKTYGNDEQLQRADLACEEILKRHYKLKDLGTSKQKGLPIWTDKLTPKLYPGAEDSFMEYILNFAGKLGEDEHEDRIALLAYGRAHKSIVIKNMAQKGVGELAKRGIPPNQVKAPLPAGMGGQPTPPQMKPKGPPMPSPALGAKVAKRGAKPLGHMPVKLPARPQRMPSAPAGKPPIPAPQPAPAAA